MGYFLFPVLLNKEYFYNMLFRACIFACSKHFWLMSMTHRISVLTVAVVKSILPLERSGNHSSIIWDSHICLSIVAGYY